jgi:DNA-binding LacI/PurR family transcriptional regulator
MAFGVMSAARRHGLDVPGDVSVIGIDDHVHAEIFDLTTVRQDVEVQGRRAGNLILDALHGRAADTVIDDVHDVELVVRGSTAAPRRRAPRTRSRRTAASVGGPATVGSPG